MRILPSKDVAVGNCVIVNEFDRPSGHLLAVVVAIDEVVGVAYCKYLCAHPSLDRFNLEGGIPSPVGVVTPVSRFGVEVQLNGEFYQCVKTGDTVATYQSGEVRNWSPVVSDSKAYRARPEILEYCND